MLDWLVRHTRATTMKTMLNLALVSFNPDAWARISVDLQDYYRELCEGGISPEDGRPIAFAWLVRPLRDAGVDPRVAYDIVLGTCGALARRGFRLAGRTDDERVGFVARDAENSVASLATLVLLDRELRTDLAFIGEGGLTNLAGSLECRLADVELPAKDISAYRFFAIADAIRRLGSRVVEPRDKPLEIVERALNRAVSMGSSYVVDGDLERYVSILPDDGLVVGGGDQVVRLYGARDIARAHKQVAIGPWLPLGQAFSYRFVVAADGGSFDASAPVHALARDGTLCPLAENIMAFLAGFVSGETSRKLFEHLTVAANAS